MSVTIEIDAVRAAIAVPLDALQESFGPSVTVQADSYWHLSVKAAFDPEQLGERRHPSGG